MRRRLVVSLGLGISMLMGASSAQASFPGTNGRIAIPAVCCSDVPHFETIDSSGRWLSVRTGAVADARSIAWSPSGKQVAFDAPGTGSGRAIYIENADGTGLRRIGRGDLLRRNPTWSPDGSRLAFVQDNARAGSGDIYTMTTSGGSLTRLTTSAAWDGEPDWSPDGTRIAYSCLSGGRRQICQMSPTGASKTATTASLNLIDLHNPSWSPNGASLAFSAHDATGGRAIYRMSRAGGSLRRLRGGDPNVGANGPAWSPDGTRIAVEEYVPDSEGVFGIRTMSAVDGSDLRWAASTEDVVRLDPDGWQPLR